MSFETLICPTQIARKAFASDCYETFNTEAGRRLLATLCQAQHPLAHLDGMTAHEHGRAEVIATLWRFGSGDSSLPIKQPTPTPTPKGKWTIANTI